MVDHGGPRTESLGWSMHPGPCFVYVPPGVVPGCLPFLAGGALARGKILRIVKGALTCTEVFQTLPNVTSYPANQK